MEMVCVKLQIMVVQIQIRVNENDEIVTEMRYVTMMKILDDEMMNHVAYDYMKVNENVQLLRQNLAVVIKLDVVGVRAVEDE